MTDRDPILPLVISLLLAVAVHAGALGGYNALIHADLAEPPAPPPRPDLSITNVDAPDPRIAGRPGPIDVTVRLADASLAAPFDVELLVDDRPVARFTRNDPLDAGATFTHTFIHAPAEPGVHRIRAVVDPADSVAESDETNNALETAAVWSAPATSESDADKTPDLAIASLDMPGPRIAGQRTTLIARVANLGGPIRQPVRIRLLIDGQPAGTGTLPDGLATDAVARIELPITVDASGPHEFTLIADPPGADAVDDADPACANDAAVAAPAVADADLSNNRMTRTFEFQPPTPQIKLGQLEPSDLDINWIAYEDYKDLLARKARFDQAVSQATVEPTPDARQAPRDPTPPAPKPSQQPSKPSPAVAVTPVEPSPPKLAVAPAPDPKKPTQQQPETIPTAEKPRHPPAMKLPTPDAVAAAPRKADDPIDPAKIDPTPTPGKDPQPITDTQPAKQPTPAPPATGLIDRTVALLTPQIKPIPGDNPLLPDPVVKPEPTEDKAIRRAPDAPIKPDADPTDKSAKVDAEQPGRAIAALPLDPKPNDKPASPTKDEPTDKTPDREMKRVDKPTDPQPETPDGAAPQDPAKEQKPQTPQKPSPARPEASDQPARPTAAPLDTREAPPVTRIENLTVKPGRVIARQGLRINTVEPRFSPIAIRSSVPANPDAILTFNRAGQVIHARFLRSTGYANIDGPLLAAFYKWSAEGPLLDHVAETWTAEFRILLTGDE